MSQPDEPSIGPVVGSTTVGRSCTVAGCRRAHLARGYCRPHYLRWQRGGNPHPEAPIATRRHGATTYRTAHAHVRAERGPATAQRCAECGTPAVLWCYDGADPPALTDPRGRRYSVDPVRYRPRCRSCHRRAALHGPRVVGFDVDRAERLYRAGATARGIGSLLHASPGAVVAALRARDVPIRPAGRRPRTPRSAPARTGTTAT